MKWSRLICFAVFSAFTFFAASCTKSEIVAPVTYTDTVGDVIFSPTTGAYADPQSFQVSLSTPSPLASIYYTLDGSTPSIANGFRYTNAWTASLSSGSPTYSLKAIAVYSGWQDSKVTNMSYTLTNLVGKWLLNENTGTSTADGSGFANNGTLTGNCTWVAGKNGAAVNFDQISVGYVNCGTAAVLNLNDNLTFTAWVNSASVTNTYEICGKYAYPNNGYQFNLTSSRFLNFTAYNGTSFGATGTGAVPTGWVQVAVTLKSRVVSFYINGAFSSTATLSADMVVPTTAAFIISHNYAPGCFIGAIDNLRVYNTAMSAAQIAYLYSANL